MVDTSDGMDGPQWPAEWQTGWVTFRYSDITGAPLAGNVTITNSAKRAVAKNSHTTVYGGSIKVPLTNGVPGGVNSQENADGVLCIEFPIGNDPDVVPAEMQIVCAEDFSGSTIYATLTSDHTLDNPLWLTDDLTTVRGQAGVFSAFAHFLDTADTPIPSFAKVGDVVVYLDSDTYFQIESL